MAAIIRMDEFETTRFELASRVVLGRDSASTIVLCDPRVSQTHAEIRRLATGEYQLRNLSATNGTYVRGVSVTEALLADGDPIVLGATRFFFEADPRATQPSPVRATLQAVPAQTLEQTAEEPSPADGGPHGQPAGFKPQSEITDIAQLRCDYEKLRGAYELLRAIDDEVTLDGILERIVELSTAIFGADRAVVFLIDPQTGQPTPKMAKQRVGDPWKLALSETVLREVMVKRTALLCEDVELDSRFSHANSVVCQGIRTVMCVPLLHETELLGMIYLDSRVATRVFSEIDLEVFTGIANQAAAAVRSATLKSQLRDVEQRRTAAIRGLISGASHFINNPLAVIRANLDMLATWRSNLVAFHQVASHHPELQAIAAQHNIEVIDEELGLLTEESLAAACRIAGIVHAMRLYEQISGEMALVDIGELLVTAAARLEPVTVGVARIHLRIGTRAKLMASAGRLGQLFDNLVLNAVQAISAGASQDNWILICAETQGTQLVVTVEDSGCGLPPGSEDQIFVPFFTSRLDGSLGLGLAVAAEIVHQHHGTISAANHERGARITVRFPLAV